MFSRNVDDIMEPGVIEICAAHKRFQPCTIYFRVFPFFPPDYVFVAFNPGNLILFADVTYYGVSWEK